MMRCVNAGARSFLRVGAGARSRVVAAARPRLAFSSAIEKVDYFKDVAVDDKIQFGDFQIIASNSVVQRNYAHVEDLGVVVLPGEKIWLRGRISSIRQKGNVCFAVMRSKSFFTLQLCHFRDKSNDMSKALIDFTGDIPLESIVDVYGEVQAANVKSCTQRNVEISIKKIFVVSRAPTVLPFSVEDASRYVEL
jgi:aspartyl-tRNA synthetase